MRKKIYIVNCQKDKNGHFLGYKFGIKGKYKEQEGRYASREAAQKALLNGEQ